MRIIFNKMAETTKQADGSPDKISIMERVINLLDKIPGEKVVDKPEEEVFISESLGGERGNAPYVLISDQMGTAKGRIEWNSIKGGGRWEIVENATGYDDAAFYKAGLAKVKAQFPESKMQQDYPAPKPMEKVESVIQ